VLTAITIGSTAAVTASRLTGTAVLGALRRDPAALKTGQVWRLVSPVLVQSDHSVAVVVATLATCTVVGALGEQVFSRRRWLTLYLLGALVGHGIGELFQPLQSGTSVAFAAILGGLAAYALAPSTHLPRPVRIEAALAVPAAIADTVLRDIHGLPFIAGLVLVVLWLRLDRRPSPAATTLPTGPSGLPPRR
jgi:hypothetical protein